MDGFALRLANILVGNADESAGLEITLAGPTLSFGAEALIALTGAEFDAMVDGERAPAWRPLWVPAGARTWARAPPVLVVDRASW